MTTLLSVLLFFFLSSQFDHYRDHYSCILAAQNGGDRPSKKKASVLNTDVTKVTPWRPEKLILCFFPWFSAVLQHLGVLI